VIKAQNINLSSIESRPSLLESWDYDFFIDFDSEKVCERPCFFCC